ncbi:type II toxin-antitoxin system VapC family toxin [Nostoc sp. FACHB-280]|uniref:type II toxin-antitoxin system tRNA(fMet)-specific endonuclease VapC n=1 Tax=Nostoc sp. FACHB-280 TaxID=2692839 RepID=UPI00168B6A38|nr:type II toxin-antitoxin system VapC family toxin [Nostoc sp. FACHB-280]MBD2493574.1 type II toxin-antitoxin system VapC family toxin [Nostoc sp. FACHB-280]
MNKNAAIYLIDTNVCIRYLNGRSSSIKNHIDTLEINKIAVCSVVKAELFYGSLRSNNTQKNLKVQKSFLQQFVSLPFDDHCAEIYGTVRADLANKGTPISLNDLQIASIALANNLILVTHNVREFSRVNGLQIEDWEVM